MKQGLVLLSGALVWDCACTFFSPETRMARCMRLGRESQAHARFNPLTIDRPKWVCLIIHTRRSFYILSLSEDCREHDTTRVIINKPAGKKKTVKEKIIHTLPDSHPNVCPTPAHATHAIGTLARLAFPNDCHGEEGETEKREGKGRQRGKDV